jgi:hypothetical protein
MERKNTTSAATAPGTTTNAITTTTTTTTATADANTLLPSRILQAQPILVQEPNVIPVVPVNVHTRGWDSYRQVGVLHEIDACGNNPRILPLYGRQTYPSSSKWNFYTTTDGYHLLKLPVFYKNKDCTDQYGCDEIFSGDELYVKEYQSTFQARLYNDNQIRYIPYVL